MTRDRSTLITALIALAALAQLALTAVAINALVCLFGYNACAPLLPWGGTAIVGAALLCWAALYLALLKVMPPPPNRMRDRWDDLS